MESTHDRKRRVLSDINVTPLVDVMLVLLIIFMITAPMMTRGVNVDLPETTAKPIRQEEKPLMITIKREGAIFLNRIKVDQKILKQQLLNQAGADTERPVYLKADRQVPYGLVVAVMADIKDAGFSKLGMITRPPEKNHGQ